MLNMYLALDFANYEKTKSFIEENDLVGVPVKVGMELFYHEGTRIINYLKENNHSVFLDLKLFDIPTTVEKAMRNLAKYEVDFVNVHALGGSEMIKRATEGLQSSSQSAHKTNLLAVTILTSMDDQVIYDDLGLSGTVNEEVVRLAKIAEKSGANGVVCSVHEANLIKSTCEANFKTMTPGIRMSESQSNDQKRIATPTYAKQNGSDYIVIGRSVTASDKPKEAYDKALGEWKNDTTLPNCT